MHERERLDAATHFLQRMSVVSDDPKVFQYELGAFLMMSRTVLQFALKEAKTVPRGQAWYETAVKADPIIHYFKEKRNASVHSEPVRPRFQASVALASTLTMTSSLGLAIMRQGQPVEELRVEHAAPSATAAAPARIEYRHTFDDRTGPEDVLTLGHQYMNSLTSFVDGGVAAGYITG